MTNDQINAAIAEECGWTQVEAIHRSGCCNRAIYVGRDFIPDYCNDLNAMHDAENFLTENKLSFMYEMNLGRNGGNRYNWSKIHATARQRAEAFLRTIGKWEESKRYDTDKE